MVRRFYTPELANKSLPLVRRIATDLQGVARHIQELWPQLQARPQDDDLAARVGNLRDRLQELVRELQQLGIELKDPLAGLLDFRARRGENEVYLCWRLGEPAVGHWHALDGGFAGRRPMSEF